MTETDQKDEPRMVQVGFRTTPIVAKFLKKYAEESAVSTSMFIDKIVTKYVSMSQNGVVYLCNKEHMKPELFE